MTTPEEQSPQRSTTEPAGQMEMTIGERRRYTLIVACCLFGGLNFFGPVMLDAADSALSVALIAGAISAELALTATWAVLGPGRACWRFLAAFLATAGLALVLLGLLFATLPFQWEPAIMFSPLLFLPLVFLAAQVPLWLFRLGGGYQLVDLHQPPNDGPLGSRQFGLAHLFAATTVLAVSVGLASCGLQLWGDTAPRTWIGLLITCGVVAVCGVLTTLPALWAVYGPREDRRQAITLLALCPLPLGLVESTFLPQLGSPAEAVATFVAFVAYHTAVVIATAIPFGLLRRLGYRLERAAKTSTAAEPDTAGHGDPEIEEEAIGADSATSEETG